jgi:hypothetical protein
MGWLEQQFANWNIIILVIFGICCGGLAAIIAAIAYFTSTDPKAKQNALIVLIIGILSWLGFCGCGFFSGGSRNINVPGQ